MKKWKISQGKCMQFERKSSWKISIMSYIILSVFLKMTFPLDMRENTLNIYNMKNHFGTQEKVRKEM